MAANSATKVDLRCFQDAADVPPVSPVADASYVQLQLASQESKSKWALSNDCNGCSAFSAKTVYGLEMSSTRRIVTGLRQI